jgi:hypothetical protein
MTPSKKAKKLGLKSLTQVSELTGQSLQTLTNWFNNKPELFEVVLLGCKYKIEKMTNIG